MSSPITHLDASYLLIRSSPSTAEVLDHHLKCFADRDMEGVLADYSADAVFFGPEGALRGPNAIKPASEKVFAGLPKARRAFAMKQRITGEWKLRQRQFGFCG